MNILYVASTNSHIQNFHSKYIEILKKNGHNVFILPNDEITFEKSIFSLKNLVTSMKIISFIHKKSIKTIITNTALASFFTRLAVALSCKKINVINIVHGYLFTKPSIFLFAERLFRPNHSITMNIQDYNIAKKYKLQKNSLNQINGMGVNFEQLNPKKQQHTGFNLVFIGEFNKRKNQEFLIYAMQNLPKEIKLILAGDGKKLDECMKLAKKLNLENRIDFKGYVKNISDLYNIADVCVSASNIEGLPFNIMEAMHFYLPLVVSNVKGNSDLCTDNGLLFNNIDQFCNNIMKIYNDKEIYAIFADNSKINSEKYAMKTVFENNMDIILKLIN